MGVMAHICELAYPMYILVTAGTLVLVSPSTDDAATLAHDGNWSCMWFVPQPVQQPVPKLSNIGGVCMKCGCGSHVT